VNGLCTWTTYGGAQMHWNGIALLESDGPLEPNSGYESLSKIRLEDEVQGQDIAEAL
jgi:hypothetical protein